MTKQKAERAALLTAGAVIIALTIAAFWLSYAHLADVALAHGLARSPERAWAWPGTIDLFILAGEVLMFRAALRGGWDWWAVGLTAAGSLGSIGLNVAGVGTDQLSLEHVVAAVPPTAALLAFGALMRQVHSLVEDSEPTPAPEENTHPETVNAPVPEPVHPAPAQPMPASAKPLVICGDHLGIPAVPPRPRIESPAEARAVIERAWRDGLSIREAARLATRSTTRVQAVYAALDAKHGPAPIEGQTTIELEVA